MPRGIYPKNQSHWKHTEGTKRKIGEALKGNKYGFQKGIHPITEFKRGQHSSPKTEYKKGGIPWNKGIPCSQETREKLSKVLKGKKGTMVGKHHSEETKRKISEKHKKNPNRYWLGKHLPDGMRKRISESLKGEKSYNWRGGKSFEPYSVDWTETLKRAIRE